jgi:hypothetical protein
MIAVYAKRPPARAPHDLSALGTVYCSGGQVHGRGLQSDRRWPRALRHHAFGGVYLIPVRLASTAPDAAARSRLGVSSAPREELAISRLVVLLPGRGTVNRRDTGRIHGAASSGRCHPFDGLAVGPPKRLKPRSFHLLVKDLLEKTDGATLDESARWTFTLGDPDVL